VSGLRECGHDVAPILAAVGIDDAMLDDPDTRVPTSVAMALLARSVEQTGDSNLGLHLAERAQLGSFDVHFFAMASSQTLGAAYERLCRYQRLIHETSRVNLEIARDRAVLRHQLAGGAAAPRQTAEFLLAAWVSCRARDHRNRLGARRSSLRAFGPLPIPPTMLVSFGLTSISP